MFFAYLWLYVKCKTMLFIMSGQRTRNDLVFSEKFADY